MFLLVNGANVVSFNNSFATSTLPGGTQMVWDGSITVLPSGLAQAALTVSIPGAGLGGHNSGSFALPAGVSNTFDFAMQFVIADPGNALNVTMYYAEILEAS